MQRADRGPGRPAANQVGGFAAVSAALQRSVDAGLLAGASYALLRGPATVAQACIGHADIEAGTALRPDHLFRAMSNTKLVTSLAVMLLLQDGLLTLDADVSAWIPQLARLAVLRADATTLADTEPQRSPITVRQLLTHSAGLSYGLFDPGSLLFKAYTERKLLSSQRTLTQMMDVLAELPLRFQPGTGWEYSVATDVLGHLVERISGLTLDACFAQRIFKPLGMADTGFVVAPEQQGRLVTYYGGANPLDPLVPGLKRMDGSPYARANLQPVARLSGGGGLVTSLPDMVALLRSLMPGSDSALLRPDLVALMMRNHLPPGQGIHFAANGGMDLRVEGRGFGFGGCVTVTPTGVDPAGSSGEFEWGGLAGTHWWINPALNTAGVLMAQRDLGFWNPFAFEFKHAAYRALAA